MLKDPFLPDHVYAIQSCLDINCQSDLFLLKITLLNLHWCEVFPIRSNHKLISIVRIYFVMAHCYDRYFVK